MPRSRSTLPYAPLQALATTVIFVVSALALILTGHDKGGNGAVFIGLIISTLPSLVAATKAEQAVNYMKNGLVQEKAKEGAKEAVSESGVLTRTGPVAVAQLETMNRLLSDNQDILRSIERQNKKEKENG